MRNLIFFLCLFINTIGYSQKDLLSFKVDKYDSRQELWVTNNSYSTLTIAVDFTILDNCYPDGLEDYYVIESTEQVKIATLSQSEKAYAWKWNYKYFWRLGSANAVHSDNTIYQLPYGSGSSFKLIQGYNGSFSHYGEIAWSVDFDMPENTPVLAARGGKVIQTESSFTDGGVDEYYRQRVNIVRILHPDGTIGNYYHFVYGGVTVSTGQEISSGDLIGYSGNTGYSSKPHLHFDVSKPLNGRESETIPVKFQTKGSYAEELVQGNSYSAP